MRNYREEGIMAFASIIAPFNISAIRWRILLIIYGIIYLVTRHYTMHLYANTLWPICFNVFLLSNISKFLQSI